MAVCTNKTEHLAVDLLKKIGIYDYFEYVAGYNTFEYCKPDPRHLTTTIEILDGDKNKSIMIGDSETDANAAKVFYKLKRDGVTILDLQLRYKGDFKQQPQFFATLSDEFIAQMQDECVIGR